MTGHAEPPMVNASRSAESQTSGAADHGDPARTVDGDEYSFVGDPATTAGLSLHWSRRPDGHYAFSTNPYELLKCRVARAIPVYDLLAIRDTPDFGSPDHSFLNGLYTLGPGQSLTGSGTGSAPSLAGEGFLEANDPIETYDDAVNELESAIRRSVAAAVKRCSDLGEIRVTLSGGVDSSLVAALTVELAPGAKLVTARGFQSNQELELARSVSQHLGRQLEELDEPAERVLVASELIRANRGRPYPIAHFGFPIYESLRRNIAETRSRSEPQLFTGEGGDSLFGTPFHAITGVRLNQKAAILQLLAQEVANQGGRSRTCLRAVGLLSRNRQIAAIGRNRSVERQRLDSLVVGRDAAQEIARTERRWFEARCDASARAGVSPFSYDLWTAYVNEARDFDGTVYDGYSVVSPLLSWEVLRTRLRVPHHLAVPEVTSNLSKPLLRDIASQYLPHRVAYEKKVNISNMFDRVARDQRASLNELLEEARPVLRTAGIEPQFLSSREGFLLPDWSTAYTYIRLLGLSAWIVANEIERIDA